MRDADALDPGSKRKKIRGQRGIRGKVERIDPQVRKKEGPRIPRIRTNKRTTQARKDPVLAIRYVGSNDRLVDYVRFRPRLGGGLALGSSLGPCFLPAAIRSTKNLN